MIDASGRDIHLEIDGGISPKTAGAAHAAGADVLVAGSAVFGRAEGTFEERTAGYRGAMDAIRAASAERSEVA
jgi:ribulose-phosphate 3-epimerase